MRALKEILRLVAIVALLLGLYVGYRIGFGHPIGGPCSTQNDCSQLFGSQCLVDDTGSYCSRACTNDAACPSDWHCALAHSPDTRTAGESVCSRSPNAMPSVITHRRAHAPSH